MNPFQQYNINSPRSPLSPRKFQFNTQLQRLQVDPDQVEQGQSIQFEGQNPFSFYNQENNRKVSSEEDQIDEINKKSSFENKDQVKQEKIQGNENQKQIEEHLQKIQIGQNITNKQPIDLSSTKKQSIIETKQQLITQNTTPSIKHFKETEVDFSKIKTKTPQKNKQVPQPKTQPQKKKQDLYQKEMKQDLQHLKSSFKQEKKKNKLLSALMNSPQEKKNVNLNKTFAPMPKKHYHNRKEAEQIQIEEIKMLVKMSFQKKKANYEILKEWDRKRAQNMALHAKMVEMLQNEVDKRIKSSLENFEYYQTFFREKAKQQQKYCTSPVINTRYALQNNSLSKNVYINCTVILNSLSEQNTARSKRISDFVQLIKVNILRELTQNHLNQSQKQLLKIRQKISSLKTSLKKYNSEAEQKTKQLANFFNQQSHNITRKSDKDFYRTQLSFLRQASQQILVQKKLGQYCLEYYHTAIQEEIQRSRIIRQSMLTYTKGVKQTYNIEVQFLQIQQLSKEQQIKLIQQFYSLDEMFDCRTIEVFKQKNNVKPQCEIELSNFTDFINKFNYETFDSRILLLKQFNVKYMAGSNKKELIEENCYLTITVDHFLHLFLSKQKAGVYAKPDITLKLSHKFLQIKTVKDDFVDIIKKDQKRNSVLGYFWDNKMDKTYRLKFNKKDNKEQFMDYVQKLMIEYN